MAAQCSNRPIKFCVSKPTPCWYYSLPMKALLVQRDTNKRACNKNIGYWAKVPFHVRKFPFQWLASAGNPHCADTKIIMLCTSKASRIAVSDACARGPWLRPSLQRPCLWFNVRLRHDVEVALPSVLPHPFVSISLFSCCYLTPYCHIKVYNSNLVASFGLISVLFHHYCHHPFQSCDCSISIAN